MTNHHGAPISEASAQDFVRMIERMIDLRLNPLSHPDDIILCRRAMTDYLLSIDPSPGVAAFGENDKP